jgi:molybdopterin synthase catalytic subunit|tara:strand:- start:14662 stop:14802 length:141 start_codon:yes stop_codon:yes gene_type:complete
VRKKVLEYLKKPSPKAKKELTTMEQNWVDRQLGEKDDKPAPPPKQK